MEKVKSSGWTHKCEPDPPLSDPVTTTAERYCISEARAISPQKLSSVKQPCWFSHSDMSGRFKSQQLPDVPRNKLENDF